MEFAFDINCLLPSAVTVLDRDSVRLSSKSSPLKLDQNQVENLNVVIDSMGEASALAQNLSTPITTCARLQQSDERIYAMKDAQGNKGFGAVIGILKVGRRKLFIIDEVGMQHETYPLCVLDFYVHESRQRQGCGHALFQFMLQNEDVRPQHLAVDRPSSKLIAFLQKHYRLNDAILQPYHFLVFREFLAGHVAENQGGVPTPEAAASRRRRLTSSHSAPGAYFGTASRLHGIPRGDVCRRSHPSALGSRRSFAESSLGRCSPEMTTSWKLFGVPPPAYRLFASPSRHDAQ